MDESIRLNTKPDSPPTGHLGSWLYNAYQLAMAGLALAVVWLLMLPDEPWVQVANIAIWAVFLADYLVRLLRATDRRRFVRDNLADLIAIVPLDLLVGDELFGLGRLARLARFVRLLRAAQVLWRISRSTRGILGTNHLGYLLLAMAGVIVIGGAGIWTLEPEIGSFQDGLWWAVVTATTVGYGDIAPKTLPGRMLATALMVMGIGTIGMVTASLATYFLGHERDSTGNPHIAHVAAQLDRWDELSPEERRQTALVLKALADDPGPESSA